LKTIGLALAGVLLAASACTSEEGAHPKCVQDINAEKNEHLDNGCNQFATCRNAAGDAVPAAQCCVDQDGIPYEGVFLEICLYGYGEGDIPIAGAGTGGTGGTGGGGS
jgi:hypothetical protein